MFRLSVSVVLGHASYPLTVPYKQHLRGDAEGKGPGFQRFATPSLSSFGNLWFSIFGSRLYYPSCVSGCSFQYFPAYRLPCS